MILAYSQDPGPDSNLMDQSRFFMQSLMFLINVKKIPISP